MKEIVPIYVVYWYIMSITLLGDEINTKGIVSVHVVYEYIMSITLLGRGNEREGNCFNTCCIWGHYEHNSLRQMK